MHYTISLDDGKYTYILDRHGQRVLRHGEEWRDLTGDKFVYLLAMKVEALDCELFNVKRKLANIAEGMRTRARNNPNGVKATTLEAFAEDVDELFNTLEK